ncbi:MAG: lysine--tRNA ligase [Nanoarchaeota archaeon]|nr:lysine--tRNA ligase [Nanoarchaeota archaeon]
MASPQKKKPIPEKPKESEATAESKEVPENAEESYHWAERLAERTIREKGNKKKYTVAAGITPSGTVHIGNFREIITVDLVRKSLEKKGKQVRFLYSWDDYDVFRKVPQNIPQQEKFQQYLRFPIVEVPDPFGCHENYAQHFEKEVEDVLPQVGISPEFLYQNQKYQSGEYAEQIKTAVENTEIIKSILNKFRQENLTEGWLPITMFCPNCRRDTIKHLKWLGGYTLHYRCACGAEEELDFRKKPIVKLRWRTDWAMRWAYENVDFEPGGKDHSAPGGSRDTAKEIVKAVWKKEAPVYQMYDFIIVKGAGGKMSSSLGNVITLKDVLEVYEPEIVRWLFAGTRPNKEFAISFDTDVFKVYEDYDACERIAFGAEKVSEKERQKQQVAYELSHIGPVPKSMPFQPKFRHLTLLLQMQGMDVERVISYMEQELRDEDDKNRLRARATCAKNWLLKHAPEEFRFAVQEKSTVQLSEKERMLFHELADRLLEKEWTDVDLHQEIYILCTNHSFQTKDFFKRAYQVLINKERGPRLAAFILEIGRQRVAELLKKA